MMGGPCPALIARAKLDLRHCGLWQGSAPRPPPEVAGVVHDLDGCFSDSQAGELTFVDMDTFEATF